MAGKSQASGGEQSSGEAGVASAGDTLGDPGKELSPSEWGIVNEVKRLSREN